jgi:hypothetical protein
VPLSDVSAPPFNSEAEQAVLGAVLLFDDAWDGVKDQLRASDFFDRKHQVVWESFEKAAERHGRADGITVMEALRRHPKFSSSIGGYVSHLASFGVGAAHAKEAAGIVRDWSLRRRLLTLTDTVKVRVLEGDGYRTAVEEMLQSVIDSDRAKGPPEGLVDFWQVEDPGHGWLIEDLIKPQQRMFFFGHAAIGKSMLMCQATIQAWAGLPVLGKWKPAKRVRTLYVDLEMGHSSVADRRKTFEVSAKLETKEDLGRMDYWMCPDGLDLSRQESRSKLENAVSHVRPELLVIDPFYKVLGGDMYSPKDVRPATEFLDFIRRHFGCAMWLGHHNRKPVDGGNSRPSLGDLFGASVLQWWPEFVIVVDSDRLVVRKSREKWLEEGKEIPLIKGGKWWASAVEGAILQQPEKDVLDFLMENGASGRKGIGKGTDFSSNQVAIVLQTLAKKSLVRKVGGPNGGHPLYEAIT